ncbi:Rrf2 family transcriptional regulator [Thalassospira sp.]|uniref:Rrf2 family transcriptional regulator n=1 Tax=Thalassospira sp. TaxID=1912094 RepID=UPI0027352548|nr:Rrf2 family transcriptional regulator [Thalassospira sp.]MDP2697430.1 Rrf2 family transcriptional regulator [Thalassospira sp.]
MKLTIRSNHAMRMVMFCAVNDGAVASVAEIAGACNMSEAHLAKIANKLAAHGFLETVRGRNGGVRLAKPAAEINVGDIVRATEFGRCLVECFDPDTNTCPLTKVCRFQSIIGRALEAFLSVLDGYTISDLVADRENLRQAMGLTDAVPA